MRIIAKCGCGSDIYEGMAHHCPTFVMTNATHPMPRPETALRERLEAFPELKHQGVPSVGNKYDHKLLVITAELFSQLQAYRAALEQLLGETHKDTK